MIDDFNVNDFVRKFLWITENEADKIEMHEFYHLHERFDRLDDKQKHSAILDILFYTELKKQKSKK